MTTTEQYNTGTQPPPRQRRHRKLLIALGALGALLLIIIVVSIATNGSSKPTATTSTPAPTTSAPASPAKSKPATAYPAEAADKALCSAYNTDIKNGDTASIQAALNQAGGVSPGLAKDVQAVVNGTSLSQDEKNQLSVTMDCALVDLGKAPPAQGFSGIGAPASAPASQPAAAAPAAPATSAPPAAPPAAPAGPTTSQQQALDAAQNYLSLGSGFSRAGLIKQLSSQYGNGFSVADATWAVDHSGADWDAQAVMAAKGYMAMGGFSRDSLIQQLTSPYGSQFTYAQAVYAAGQVGL